MRSYHSFKVKTTLIVVSTSTGTPSSTVATIPPAPHSIQCRLLQHGRTTHYFQILNGPILSDSCSQNYSALNARRFGNRRIDGLHLIDDLTGFDTRRNGDLLGRRNLDHGTIAHAAQDAANHAVTASAAETAHSSHAASRRRRGLIFTLLMVFGILLGAVN